jgi:peptidoglycan L-alanyl-D-glutamate endopeptidase CwlK
MLKNILVVIGILCSIIMLTSMSNEEIIVDSDMTLEEALKGSKAPQKILDEQILLNVEYFSFDGKLHRGQLVINKAVKDDIVYVFEMMKKDKFPIAKCIPIVKYGWSDDKSMADNNTSAFNYRKIAGKNKLSNHSYGRAIDFNPVQNPAIYKNGKISPKGAKYDKKAEGTLVDGDPYVSEFKKRGWRWGGDWTSLKDYQHFDKVE